MKRSTTISAFVGLAVAIALWNRAGLAGDFHKGTTLVCSDCHSMHFSEEGAAPAGAEAGGPWARLLMMSTVNKLCLSCHDGTDTTAPDVVTPVSMYGGSGDEHSGGGFFANSGGTASDNAHDLGLNAAIPLKTAALSITMTCTTCHEPHGNDNFRNLKGDPLSSGTSVNVGNGTDVFQNVLPAIPPTQAGSIAAYKRSNMGYKANYAAWCAKCHDLLATNDAGTSPAHFKKHPANVALNTAGYHTDTANWIGGTPNGVGTTTGDATFGIPRLRFQVSTATNYATATTVAAGNEVFCGTCHGAHGLGYKSALVWPFEDGGTDTFTGCIQCHNK